VSGSDEMFIDYEVKIGGNVISSKKRVETRSLKREDHYLHIMLDSEEAIPKGQEIDINEIFMYSD
jgi:hypothetical protein